MNIGHLSSIEFKCNLVAFAMHNNQFSLDRALNDTIEWSIELFLKEKNCSIAANGGFTEDISGLPQSFLAVFPQEVHRDSLKGIDEWEEEVLDEELVMGCIEVVERSHQGYEDLTEFVLAFSADACALEK